MTGNNEKSALVKRTEGKNAPTSRSRFDLSYHNYITPSYGKITPFLSLEGVAGDKIPIRSSHKVRSYTMKSPLMSDVYMQKDFFAVPMECILPLNWQKIFANPVVGDDVNADECNCVFDPSKILPSDLQPIMNLFDKSTWTDMNGRTFSEGLNQILMLEKIVSKGSLFSLLGINLWSAYTLNAGTLSDTTNNYNFTLKPGSDFDDVIDGVLGYLRYLTFKDKKQLNIQVKYIQLDASIMDGYTEEVKEFAPKDAEDYDYFEDCLDFCREHYLREFVIVGANPNLSTTGFITLFKAPSENLNIASLIAYQIVCAHYFTNDRIDYIYSAELYRQMMRGFILNYSHDTFTYNGVETLYDELSGHWINKLATLIKGNQEDLTFLKAYYYFINLLGINNSLRYSDYFTGARLEPLAVGNTDIAVNANQVSVIDVTRNIQIQRFLNLVNKTGRKFEEYVGKLFGTYVAPDYHNPIYLGKIRDKIISYETENTADAQQTKQNSVTSTFSSTGNAYALEFDCDRPTIIIGVCSFDIPRVYCRTISRDALHIDRFDYYNPFMQFIGDQDINNAELGYSRGNLEFAYQSRHAEYKTKYPICSGGFAKQNVLPSWQFVADLQAFASIESSTLDSNYIRSKRSELDKFYITLTGESPATRFHFICDFYNDMSAVSRPMVANPNIL